MKLKLVILLTICVFVSVTAVVAAGFDDDFTGQTIRVDYYHTGTAHEEHLTLDRARIEGLAASHPQSQGVHDLRTRRAGSDVFIELHLELDGSLELARAHAVTDEIEGLIGQAFPEADILIHQEPAGLEDERLDARIDAGEP
jgi:hypothetical protein